MSNTIIKESSYITFLDVFGINGKLVSIPVHSDENSKNYIEAAIKSGWFKTPNGTYFNMDHVVKITIRQVYKPPVIKL